tara:strand:+ start:355 stop:891 length:537 start_codon:yes stop_codon:yes gene_type:complete
MSKKIQRINILLTGFMGTGKSTVGLILSEILSKEFVDTDQVIEGLYGPIPEIFAKEGEDVFRHREREVSQQLAERENLVIATGGKLLLDPVNAETLSANGRIFCLRTPLEEIIKRLREEENLVQRPLLDSKNFEEHIEELFKARERAYRAFEQVDTAGRSPSEIAKEIGNRILSTDDS